MGLGSKVNLIRYSRGKFLRRSDLKPPFPIYENGQKIEIDGKGDGADTTYCEVYINDCYGLRKIPRDLSPAVIVDIGANIGLFSCFASLRFPAAKIYSYEPNAEAYDFLVKNTSGRNIDAVNSAVGRSDGTAAFDTSYDSTIGRLSAEGKIQVNVIGSGRVADGSEIDLMKLDCEGGEWEIFEDDTLLKRTRSIVMEYHLDDGRTIDDMTRLLDNGDHTVVAASEPVQNVGFIQSYRRH